MTLRYFDRDGQPIDMWRWAELNEDWSYHCVKQNYVRGWKISTIWLGLNHNWFGGPPLIFETMVFPPADHVPGENPAGCEEYQARWPTELVALAGHDQVVEAVCGLLGASRSEVLDPMTESDIPLLMERMEHGASIEADAVDRRGGRAGNHPGGPVSPDPGDRRPDGGDSPSA